MKPYNYKSRVNVNAICDGFVPCHHEYKNTEMPSNRNDRNKVIVRYLEDWDKLNYDSYTLIDETSGVPLSRKDNKLVLNWSEKYFGTTYSKNGEILREETHFTFWPVKIDKGGFLKSDKSFNYMNKFSYYLITTSSAEGRFALSYNPFVFKNEETQYDNRSKVEWKKINSDITGGIMSKLFDLKMVWTIKSENKTYPIREGDAIIIVSEYATRENNTMNILGKQSQECLSNGDAQFSIVSVENISINENPIYMKGEHDKSIPVCKFKDCENECTLFSLRIHGVNNSINQKITLENLITETDGELQLNETTDLNRPIYGAGLFLLVMFLLLILVWIYVKFIPKEIDIIGNFNVNDYYQKTRDMFTNDDD